MFVLLFIPKRRAEAEEAILHSVCLSYRDSCTAGQQNKDVSQTQDAEQIQSITQLAFASRIRYKAKKKNEQTKIIYFIKIFPKIRTL